MGIRNIVRELMVQPWLVNDYASENDTDESKLSELAAPMGLRVYFAVASVMFSLIVVMYLMRMGWGHPEFGFDWEPTAKPWMLWVNTAILVLTSVIFQKARGAAKRGDTNRLQIDLLAAGLLSFAFLAGQLLVWRELIAGGYFLTNSPANSFFYMITAIHGLHMLGGLVAWTRTAGKLWSGVEMRKVGLSVDLCAIYWHFLLVVWLVMFYLMLVT
jgi:cytochrome c oxidase subunit 3